MSNQDPNKAEKFKADSIALFNQTSPETKPQSRNLTLRSAAIGLLAGVTDYVFGPSVFHVDRSSNQDEMSALLAVAAGVFLSQIRNVKTLCSTEPEKRNERRWNVLTGSTGGLLGGAAIGKLAALGATVTVAGAAIPVLIPVLVGGAPVGATGTMLYNKISRKKYCPHKDCETKGNCSQRVCRSCKRLFWPGEEKLDCSQIRFLDWYMVASFLQKSYKLSYLDAEALLEKYLGEWIVPSEKGENIVVSCERFMKWTIGNESKIAEFKGEGTERLSGKDIGQYLDSKGL